MISWDLTNKVRMLSSVVPLVESKIGLVKVFKLNRISYSDNGLNADSFEIDSVLFDLTDTLITYKDNREQKATRLLFLLHMKRLLILLLSICLIAPFMILSH